jgi:hypothetical protein
LGVFNGNIYVTLARLGLEEVTTVLRLLAALLAASLLPACVYAHDITIEAESYTASFDAGGNSIYTAYCSGASGTYAVEGFDTTGDWIEVTITTPEVGAYADTLRSAGTYGMYSSIRITIFNAGQGGGDVVSEYEVLGRGIG